MSKLSRIWPALTLWVGELLYTELFNSGLQSLVAQNTEISPGKFVDWSSYYSKIPEDYDRLWHNVIAVIVTQSVRILSGGSSLAFKVCHPESWPSGRCHQEQHRQRRDQLENQSHRPESRTNVSSSTDRKESETYVVYCSWRWRISSFLCCLDMSNKWK